MFETECKNFSDILGDEIIQFEHFGSTSVRGMKAKPVIDMMVIVKDIHRIDHYNKKLIALGYDAAGEWGITGRRLFIKGGENRTYHIHIYEYTNSEIKRHLIGRDYLRLHHYEVKDYRAFKEQLAEHHENTGEYSKAKKTM